MSMKQKQRLLSKVSKHTSEFFRGMSNWYPPKTVKWHGLVTDFKTDDKKIAVCELNCYHDDYDEYDDGQMFEIELPVEHFPVDDVRKGTIFKFQITDWEEYKKGYGVGKIPNTSYIITCYVSKRTWLSENKDSPDKESDTE